MSGRLIKQLAHNAKLRMTNTNYNEKSKPVPSNNIINFANPTIQKSQIEIKKLDTSYEEVLKHRIINLLNNDMYTLNPLAQLIDYSYFNKLSDIAKQKYIFEVSKIYNETKNEFLFSKLEKYN